MKTLCGIGTWLSQRWKNASLGTPGIGIYTCVRKVYSDGFTATVGLLPHQGIEGIA